VNKKKATIPTASHVTHLHRGEGSFPFGKVRRRKKIG
jgi:hypothetical protein